LPCWQGTAARKITANILSQENRFFVWQPSAFFDDVMSEPASIRQDWPPDTVKATVLLSGPQISVVFKFPD
jgi:hypothetical protein